MFNRTKKAIRQIRYYTVRRSGLHAGCDARTCRLCGRTSWVRR